MQYIIVSLNKRENRKKDMEEKNSQKKKRISPIAIHLETVRHT